MADINEREPESGAEKVELNQLKNLERKKGPEVSKAEIEAGEKDLARRHEAAERKLSAEKKRESDLEKEQEHENLEKHQPHVKAAAHVSQKEKEHIYTKEIKLVQDQLPRVSRAFSKVIITKS